MPKPTTAAPQPSVGESSPTFTSEPAAENAPTADLQASAGNAAVARAAEGGSFRILGRCIKNCTGTLEADPLGPDYPEGSGFRGQDGLTNSLITDPNQDADKKYVRGQLLNDNVGGDGKPRNLFPITVPINPETNTGIIRDGDVEDPKETYVVANDLENEVQKEVKEEEIEPQVKLVAKKLGTEGAESETEIEGEDAFINVESSEKPPVATVSAESTMPTAMATLNNTVANTTIIVRSPVRFAVQKDLEPSNSKEGQRRNTSEAVAGGFISRVGQQVSRFASKGMQAIPGIITTTNQSKSNTEATAIAEIEKVSAHIEIEREQAKKQAGMSYWLVASKLADTKSAIIANAKKARLDSNIAYGKAIFAVTKRALSEIDTINKHYITWEPKFRDEGSKAGTKAKLSGDKFATDWLSQQNGKSSILDGPIHDNRLKAKAKAARQVSKEYDKKLKKSANEQADKIPKSQPGVIAKVGKILAQVHNGLEKQFKSFTDVIDSSEKKGLAKADKTAKSMRSAIYSSLKKTLGSLDQQESVQVTRLTNYGEAQKQSFDGIASQTISTVADGVSQATAALNQSMADFRASATAMAAPDENGLSKELGTVEAKTNLQVSSMMQRLDDGVKAGQTGIITGGIESNEALKKLSNSAQEQATTSSVAYAESSKKLRTQASSGFGQLKAGNTKTAQQMAANVIKGFKGSEKASDKAFGELGKSVEDNFKTNSKALGDSLWSQKVQNEHDTNVKKYAKEAASKVKPRWKSVLKWVITIVVIIAVVAITILSAGSLGPVGVVLLGATLGAMAGAATQIGHNLVDGEKWNKGVVKAMIVGGIGGAFGGLGGVLFKGIGSVGLKIGLEAGLDVVGGIVGEVAGSLAVGESITWSNVVVGALIGAGIGAGLGIGGALKGKFKAKFAGPDVSVPTTKPVIETPVSAPKPAGKVRGFLEKIKVLEPSAPTAGRPRVAGPEAPTGKTTAETPPSTKPATPDASTTKVAASEAPGGKPAEPSAGPARKSHFDEPEIEDGVVAKEPTADNHNVKVTKDGRVVRCSDECAELRIRYEEEISANPKLKQRLDEIEALPNAIDKAKQAQLFEWQMEGLRKAERALGAAQLGSGPRQAAGPLINPKTGRALGSKRGKPPDIVDPKSHRSVRLDEQYQAYLTRKAREGKQARPFHEWEDVRNHWLHDHPTARGNKFNRTAAERNPHHYHEVVLANGKRVDSYRPPTKDFPGEIISRKATDFDVIDESTFRSYLSEMNNKYASGTKINSAKYEAYLPKGSELRGKLVLEVPASNRGAANRDAFERISGEMGISIRYTPE